ncbi:protein DA1 isoform X1 [Daucus carota subsp. sativus]|uniref:protein DA1 isoform X1 n=1 Tax=Daucus carota subsp. sativus TaxID=79200 RepID=UPI0007EFAAA5|nr:PREDICTED: protein DA1-like isoform X1 [Daucus carota subsp. sativus]XP_017253734.1 PREDICTED: protein DA1-like isoform X1 [Daucus carota subsp. sativus]
MGWLSKIFKGSSHNVSEGQYDWRYSANSNENYPSTSQDAWSDTEDIDRAIAISLSEENKKGKHVIVADESQLEEDEQLARALQESLNFDSLPENGNRNGNVGGKGRRKEHVSGNGTGNGYVSGNGTGNGHASGYGNGIGNGHVSGNAMGYGNGSGMGLGSGNFYQPIPFPYSTGFRICAGCNVEIGHGRFLSCMGSIWHPECFRCHACHQPIADYEFSMSGNYPYHKFCYKEHYHPKCDVCNHFIPTNAAGLIEYRAHPFWAQKYCPKHEHDRTSRCCSCERMEPQDTKYVALDDGRSLCLECLDSAIMDTDQCQPLYLDIREFYESLNMKVEQQVPLLLVERQALNEAMDGEKSGHHHMPETRGLCLSEEQTISTVLRRPRIGAGNRAMDMRTEPYKLTRRCEVTAILILYGLPRLLTGSILAHEMMHAWMRLSGYRTLSPDVEEGICQVLAHMWLESQRASAEQSNQRTSSPFDKKLGEFFKHQIESDTSPVYGNGFRAGNQAVLKYGLQRTLDHIRFTGTFPY